MLVKKLAMATIKKHKLIVPIDVNQLAIELGFIVDTQELPNEDSAYCSLERKIIILNSSHHPHRQRFSLGHELGHYMLKHNDERNIPTEEGETEKERKKRFEKEADYFSGCILMPETEFKKAFKSGCNSQILSKQFNVSQDALWVRIGQLRLV